MTKKVYLSSRQVGPPSFKGAEVRPFYKRSHFWPYEKASPLPKWGFFSWFGQSMTLCEVNAFLTIVKELSIMDR